MPRSFELPRMSGASLRDPRVAMRILLGVLALANVVAALVVFKPWGGSPADLAEQRVQLDRQVRDMRRRIEQTQQMAQKVQQARSEGDRFLSDHMMDRRRAYSMLVAELYRVAREAGIKPKDQTFNEEEVEGSESDMQISVTGGFEGTYANLLTFVNLLDKSPRFLIVESLAAAPQQGANMLNISVKLDTFVWRFERAES